MVDNRDEPEDKYKSDKKKNLTFDCLTYADDTVILENSKTTNRNAQRRGRKNRPANLRRKIIIHDGGQNKEGSNNEKICESLSLRTVKD